MPQLEVSFNVYCSCGAGLCNQTTVDSDGYGSAIITIEPCEACLEVAHADGRNEGYDEGYADGSNECQDK
jgi:hypothetical protein